MKVIVNNKEEKKQLKFPCLMISEENDNMIILVEGKVGKNYKGTVIANIFAGFRLGEWEDCFAIDEFKPFKGSVTLSND